MVHGIDWVTKLALLEEYGAQGEEALTVCNQFSLIDEGVRWYTGEELDLDSCDSLHNLEASLEYAEKRLADCKATDLRRDIAMAMMSGPSDTRDYLRSAVLRKFGPEVLQASWERIYYPGGVLRLPDPLCWGEEESSQMIASAESVEESAQRVRASR